MKAELQATGDERDSLRSERSGRVPAGALLALAAATVFLIGFLRVFLGQRVLIGGDMLYGFYPWGATPGAHVPGNILVGDPITQFLPWQMLVSNAFHHARLPLWDPYALSGKPLLANDQSAPFSPFTWLAMITRNAARGMSLAMLAKLWVAGIGMAVYIRCVGGRNLAAVAAGIAYAGSSFMVVWLAWPHTAVAALLPWAFAAVEWYLQRGKPIALAGVACAVALQFLAGHAETSLHLGLGLALYAVVRGLLGANRARRLTALAGAALLGTLVASIQVLPFLVELQRSNLVGDRANAAAGVGHLEPVALLTWLVPNLAGNPGIDARSGMPPNYNEAAGYATVAMLLLSPVGLWWAWTRRRPSAIALGAIGLVAFGTAYGPLAQLVGRLPGLAVSNNMRILVLCCFVVAALGGLGLESVVSQPRRLPAWVGVALAAASATLLAALLAGALVFMFQGAAVDRLLPPLTHHGYIRFWAALGAVATGCALGAILAGGLAGARTAAGVLLGTLVLAEVALFVLPYEPQVVPREVPPRTDLTTWLQANAGGQPVAATGTVLIPESATLYGIADVRAYDTVRPARSRLFWKASDPGYQDPAMVTMLDRPDVRWLALAGVAYVLTPAGQDLPGTRVVHTVNQVDVARVPGARPFAYLAPDWRSAPDPSRALALVDAAPTGPPVLEGVSSGAGTSPAGTVVAVDRPSPEEVVLRVRAPAREALVVLQTYDPGWHAQVDGKEVALHPANVAFQGLVVPAGEHRVVLRYDPPEVRAGALLSTAGLVLLMTIVVISAAGRWRRRTVWTSRTAG